MTQHVSEIIKQLCDTHSNEEILELITEQRRISTATSEFQNKRHKDFINLVYENTQLVVWDWNKKMMVESHVRSPLKDLVKDFCDREYPKAGSLHYNPRGVTEKFFRCMVDEALKDMPVAFGDY